MDNFWFYFVSIICGALIGIMIARATRKYNKNVVSDFKEQLKTINNYKTYNDVKDYIGECAETSYDNNFKIRSWIIRSENRELYRVSIKFDENENNLGICFESNQI